METSKLGKARAGVFLLLIAISLYSLFMISASNTYAAGQSLFRFSSLIGLSPSANSYDRQRLANNVSEKLISSVETVTVPTRSRGISNVAALDESEVASFLSSPRKSSFRRIVAAGSSADDSRSGFDSGLFLLPFNNANASISSGLISECIESVPEDLETGERDVDAVIACIFNGGTGGNGVLADGTNDSGTGNPVDPFDNNDPDGTGVSAGDPNGDGGTGGNGDSNANGDDGNGGDSNGNDGNGGTDTVIAEVPEPSTYLLLGLGMITLVGFSRKKAKARIS